ncbi:TlpA family protein disulfide reductase [Janthinobacterium psychrotolerans]|uniref:Outer membrane receptor for ferrienterochelin and colicins n=1 Tax=Janthinobacterium psychrotolerans TaxID=1747903 RepID=A0A1A7C3M6_9BURK|nr:TlpA disulfide reductase family protein [Janthinobacterium psychrotolerans]OBV38913.1 outer membrane receptor for ferrienterochelin and colicins [Janthinobacterium psychrotolerans]
MSAVWLMAALALAQPNPDFKLPALDASGSVTLAALPGPVLLNFWASNCLPCVRELPLLQAQSRRLPGLRFVGIAIDEGRRAAPFARKAGTAYVQLAAPGRQDLLRQFGNPLGALPYTVVLNGAHQVCTTRLGTVDAQWLERAAQACAAR